MLVNLLPVSDPALVNQRAGGSPSTLDFSSTRPFGGESDDLRERVRRDDQREEMQLATFVATRPSDVISDAERNIERCSRTFRRQVARETGAEQFRQERHAFRQALTDANGRRPQPAPREAVKQAPQSQLKAPAGDGSGARSTDKASPRVDFKSSETHASSQPARTTGSDVTRVPATRGNLPALTGGSAQAANATIAGAAGARASQSNGATATLLSTAASISRPSGVSNARASGMTSTAAASPRGTAKPSMPFAARSGEARSAESAPRDANIERIVRVIRNRLNGDRSHTVIRLDPPELGRVRLQMDLRGASLTLQVDTTTELAHRLLSKDLEKLRDGLEASGIQLARVEVRPPTPVPEANEQAPSQQADTQDDADGGSAQADAEHPQKQGKDSRPAGPTQTLTRELNLEPAAESLVNVVA